MTTFASLSGSESRRAVQALAFALTLFGCGDNLRGELDDVGDSGDSGDAVDDGGDSSDGGSNTLPAAPVDLVIQLPEAQLPVGHHVPLHAVATLDTGAVVDATGLVTWTVSNGTVAMIDGHAIVGAAVGSTTLTATLGDLTATAPLTVIDATLDTIAIAPAAVTVAAHTTAQIAATGTFSDGIARDVTAEVMWATSDAAVATVSGGRVTGGQAGHATVTASAGGASATADVNVTSSPLTGIAIGGDGAMLPLGASLDLSASGMLGDGTSVDVTDSVTWTSSAPAIVAVSADPATAGRITAIAAGTATITATLGSFTAKLDVAVTAEAILDHLELVPGSLALEVGATGHLQALGVYSDGSHLDLSASATWTTSNAAVVTIGMAPGTPGEVHAIGVGTAIVTVTLGAEVVTLPVSVMPETDVQPSSLQIVGAPGILPLGLTTRLAALAHYPDGHVVDVTEQTDWSATGIGILISNLLGSRGEILAISVGQNTVTAQYRGLTARVTIGTTLAIDLTP